MPRRNKPPKRTVALDPRYNSTKVEMFINRVMRDGKKSTARHIVYEAMDMVEQRAKKPAREVFEEALRNVTPKVEVRPRRVGGSTYQIPIEVGPHRANTLAMRWLLQAARTRGGRGFSSKLANEILDAYGNQGNAIKKKEDTHRMAEANRTFSHFRV